MKKPQILLIILFIIAFAVTLFSPHVISDEGIYLDIEQMNLFRTDTGFAINTNTNNTPLNSHQAFIGLLSNFGGVNTFSLAIIYGVLLLLGMVLIVNATGDSKYAWTNYALPVIMVLIFLDFAYAGYFKTLYAAPFATVIMALWIGVMLNVCKSKDKWYLYIIASVLAAVFGCIGTVYGVFAVMMAIVIMLLGMLNKNKTARILAIALGAVVVVTSIVFVSTYHGAEYEKNIYNAVFFGIAKNDTVTSIGLDGKLDELKEVFITEDIKAEYDLENTLYSKVDYKKIIGYYIFHPGKAVKMFDLAAKNAFFKPYDDGAITLYSTLKQTFLPNTMLFVLGFILVVLGYIIYVFRKHRDFAPYLILFISFVTMASSALKLPVMLCGIYDISKGMFPFNLMFDILLTVAIIGGSRIMHIRREAAKEKFGITQ